MRHRRLAQPRAFGEEAHQRLVGGTLHGRRGQPEPDLRLRGPRPPRSWTPWAAPGGLSLTPVAVAEIAPADSSLTADRGEIARASEQQKEGDHRCQVDHAEWRDDPAQWHDHPVGQRQDSAHDPAVGRDLEPGGDHPDKERDDQQVRRCRSGGRRAIPRGPALTEAAKVSYHPDQPRRSAPAPPVRRSAPSRTARGVRPADWPPNVPGGAPAGGARDHPGDAPVRARAPNGDSRPDRGPPRRPGRSGRRRKMRRAPPGGAGRRCRGHQRSLLAGALHLEIGYVATSEGAGNGEHAAVERGLFLDVAVATAGGDLVGPPMSGRPPSRRGCPPWKL